MARYSKVALYKLQNEVHKINKPLTQTDFGRKIVQIPEAHVLATPPVEKHPKLTEVLSPETKQETVIPSTKATTQARNNTSSTTRKTKPAAKTGKMKTLSSKKTGTKTTLKKTTSTTMAKYSKKAGDKVEKTMHEMKQGTLRSGGSGKKVKSRKQAIAIGLSEARKAGAKVPKAPAKKTVVKKSAAKKAPVKKATAKKTAAKKASPRKSAKSTKTTKRK